MTPAVETAAASRAEPPRPLARRLRSGAIRGLLQAALDSRIWPLARALSPPAVDVLLHHRIADPDDPSFFGFKGNISATPAMFARQLDYLGRHHTVIDLATFEAAIVEGRALPRNALLITFDDGYADNLDVALPELLRRGMPAVLFLATGFVGDRKAFAWDTAADAFSRTGRVTATVPLLGDRQLATRQQREAAVRDFIMAAKRIPDPAARAALDGLAAALDVELAYAPIRRTHVDWADVGRLSAGGFAICPHTVDHPILSRISVEEARSQVIRSRQEIERRTGTRTRTFAYPNGTSDDFGPEHAAMLAEEGFAVAFRSDGGRAFLGEARRCVHAVRRICIGARDDVPRMAAKLGGLTRLTAI
jgi:peptidoglycan/xylan/chitin deacetylase (PgdA/CDA1 family)